MAKPFRGFVPRPTKGELVAAAKEQAKQNSSLSTLAEATEQVASVDVGTLDQKVAEALKGADEQGPPPPAPLVSETPAAPAPPPAPKKDDAGAYMLGKKYAPKTDRNSETWAKITKALSEGPKTLKELSEVVKGHGDFIGYMTRGGHIVPYVQQEAKV